MDQQQTTEQAPQPASPQMAENPGKGLGIAGLIVAFFAPLVGLILSIIGMSKSKKAGMSNGAALAGIIVSVIFMVIQVIVFIVIIAGTAAVVTKCNDLGPGTHVVDGVTYTCGSEFAD